LLFEPISQIKYKDMELTIGAELGRTRKALASSSALKGPQQLVAAPEKKDEIAALMNLAHGSPRNAIIESWRLLQDLLIEVAKRKGHDFLSLPATVPYALTAAFFLHGQKIIPDSVAAAIQNLSAIHAKVIDNPDFQPTVDDAQQFVLYSASVREDLEKIQ
jgi:hypothetical protein